MTESEKGNVKPVFNPKEFISMKELKYLSNLTPWKCYLDILLQYIAIACAIGAAIYIDHFLFTIVSIIFIGARFYSLGMLLHEGLHYRITADKRKNDFIMKYFLAIPLFIDPIIFRRNHLEHHLHLHTHDDPEFERRNAKIWHFPMRPMKLFMLLVLDVTGLSLPFMVFSHKGYVVPDEKKKKSLSSYLRLLIYVLLFSVFVYFGIMGYVLLFWILPLLTWGNLLIRLRRISEHCGIEVNEELISRSRTTIANFLERIFICPCNINFHNEHHLYPSVPYYNLPLLHKKLMLNSSYQKKIHISYGYAQVLKECTNPKK